MGNEVLNGMPVTCWIEQILEHCRSDVANWENPESGVTIEVLTLRTPCL